METLNKKKLLFILNTAEFFLSHRLQLAKKAREEGFCVEVLCPYQKDFVEEIKNLGFNCHNITMTRKGVNPFKEFATLLSFYWTLKKINPDVVHSFTLKPILYSTLLKPLLSYKLIVTFTGLGHLFISTKIKIIIVRNIVALLLKINFLFQNRIHIIFQNPDDQQLFENLNIVSSKISLVIPGTGVDMELYKPNPNNLNPVIVFPARFLKEKGIFELLKACQILFDKKINFELWLLGKRDEGNPSSITEQELNDIKNLPFVSRIEFSKSMHEIFSQAQLVCLPSYREGLPQSLIEACASGRAIITTDAPGCRSIVNNGINGFLVPVHDHKILSQKIELILKNKNLRIRMEEKSRAKAKYVFDKVKILKQNIDLYKS